MDKDLFANYKAVLADLRAKKERILADLKQVDAGIATLTTQVAAQEAEERAAQQPSRSLLFIGPAPAPAPLVVPDHLVYAGISVRWAVLSLMAERAKGPMRTADMAEALVAGGVRSSGQNFAANVSAVASEMARKKGELTADDGKYQITDHGREVWDGIKHSRQYRYRRIAEAVAATESAISYGPN